MGFGPREILIIVLIIVLLFGAKKIPELMRSIGSGFREFKHGVAGDDDAEATPGTKRQEIDQKD